MKNMKLLAVATTLYINTDCSNQNTFWEKKITGEEKFTLGEFIAVNMKICGRHNVRKRREIKDSDKYINLDTSLNFFRLEKMIITSSEARDYLGRSGKGLVNSLGLKEKSRPNKYKKARYVIGNVSMKDLSKITREFENFPFKGYERKKPKHDPTDS